MRKLVFFLLMLACGMQLSAQSAEQTEEQPQTEADTLVCNHPMPQHLQASMPRRVAEAAACPVDSIAGYDDKGNVTSTTLYEYDAAGNTVAEAQYRWIEGVKTGVSYYRKYFTGSTATITVNYQWDGTSHDWIGRDSTILFYNGNINTGSAYYVMENGEWRPQTLYEYEYNAAGKRTLSLYSRWNATLKAVEYVDKYEWEFDAAGNQTKNLYWLYKGGQWVGSKGTVTGYDEKNNKILEEKYAGWENNGWKGTSKNTYVYNDSKKLIEQVTYTWSGGWVEKSKTTKEYSGSNITDNATYSWQNGAWVGISRTTKTYTGSLVQTETVWAWDGDNAVWVPAALSEYTYTGSKILTCTVSRMAGGSWEYVSKLENTYNASSRIERETTLAWKEGAWADSLYTAYEYSAKGVNTLKVSMKNDGSLWQATDSVKHEVEYGIIGGKEYTLSDIQMQWTASDGKWTGMSRSEWQYDEAGNMIQADTYNFIGGKWINNNRQQYAYKDNNSSLRTLEMNMTWDNKRQQWTGNSRNEYGYDDTNRKTINIIYKWNIARADWESIGRSEDIYDGKVLTAKYAYKWDAAAWDWTGMFHYDYTYDKAGRTVEQLIKSYDAAAGEYVNNTRYEYGFDEKNRQVRSDVYTWIPDAGEWCLHTKEETEYDDDADGKLRYHLNMSWSNCILNYYDKEQYYYACDPKYYTVRFLDWDGKELQSEKLLEGTKPEYKGEKPERAADAQYTYTFAGWDKEIAAVAGEASYTATYSSTLNQYTVTFYDEDGTTKLWSGEFDYGTTPVYGGSEPEKTADAQYTYTFAGWDNEIVAVTGEASYTATYSSTLNRYTVTFYDEDGTTKLWSGEFDYGTTPAYGGGTPEKTADAQYTYTFAGWDKELAAVSGEASYTATYSSTLNQYTVTFYDEDGTTKLWSGEFDYGTTPVYGGSEPEKTADAQYTYTFAGWDKELAAVSGEASYTATYSSTLNQYTVTFYDEDGTKILWKEVLDYGATPVYKGEKPMKEGNQQYSYSFMGWDEDIVPVTGDAVYKAVFMQNINKFTVTFRDADGVTELQSQNYEYGQVPVYEGVTPTKTGDAQYSYVFDGWDKEITAVTEYTVYTAQYKEVVNEYLVTFYDEDGTTVLWSGKFEYGATAVYGGTAPATTGDAQYSHVFKGWNRELGVVTGETSYTAQYEDVLNMYRITFYDEDGETVLDSREWEYGSTPAYMGTTPVKAEDEDYTYIFSGWDKEIAAVTGEASYTASYTATAKTPTSIGGMQETAPKAVKVVENGVMYIVIDGVKYNATGVVIN